MQHRARLERGARQEIDHRQAERGAAHHVEAQLVEAVARVVGRSRNCVPRSASRIHAPHELALRGAVERRQVLAELGEHLAASARGRRGRGRRRAARARRARRHWKPVSALAPLGGGEERLGGFGPAAGVAERVGAAHQQVAPRVVVGMLPRRSAASHSAAGELERQLLLGARRGLDRERGGVVDLAGGLEVADDRQRIFSASLLASRTSASRS